MNTTHTPLLARQPIFNRKQEVVAFELLSRSHNPDQADVDDGDHATSELIINAFTSFPIEELIEDKPAYINFTRRLLDTPPPIARRHIVLEILEEIPVDEALIDRVRQLKNDGYTIALDDYLFDDQHHSLLELADIIKIDVLEQDWESVCHEVKQLEPYTFTLLAEKVETLEMYERCTELGFELFQGFFLSKPQLLSGQRLDLNQQSVLQLFSKIHQPDIEMSTIEKIISTDVVLSYKLLRLANSTLLRTRNEINSIAQAVAHLGLNHIRQWAALIALTKMNHKPAALMMSSLVRARLAEELAILSHSSEIDPSLLFTAALISTMDAHLEMPLEEIIAQMQLSDTLRDTILQRNNQAGFLLSTAEVYERAELTKIDWARLRKLGITPIGTNQAYFDTLKWSRETLQALND